MSGMRCGTASRRSWPAAKLIQVQTELSLRSMTTFQWAAWPAVRRFCGRFGSPQQVLIGSHAVCMAHSEDPQSALAASFVVTARVGFLPMRRLPHRATCHFSSMALLCREFDIALTRLAKRHPAAHRRQIGLSLCAGRVGPGMARSTVGSGGSA